VFVLLFSWNRLFGFIVSRDMRHYIPIIQSVKFFMEIRRELVYALVDL